VRRFLSNYFDLLFLVAMMILMMMTTMMILITMRAFTLSVLYCLPFVLRDVCLELRERAVGARRFTVSSCSRSLRISRRTADNGAHQLRANLARPSSSLPKIQPLRREFN